MKVYVIVPINYEYNDEYYSPEGFEEPVAAFRGRAKAAERLYDMEQEKREQYSGEDFESGRVGAFYKLVELAVPDSDVEAA